MSIDIVDRLVRLRAVACRGAVVVDLGAGHEFAGLLAAQREVAEVAGETDLDEIEIVRAGAARGESKIGAGILVEGAAAANAVTEAVVERPDRSSVQLTLNRLLETGIARDFAEIPTFAVERHLGTVDAVLGEGELVECCADRRHVLRGMVAHQVEAEAIDAVILRPGHDRIDHEFLGHVVLGGDVLAASRRLDLAHRVESVIVAGNDLVEDRLLSLPGLRGVVEHLVEHHSELDVVQRRHHLPELERALAAVGRFWRRSVGTVGRHEVVRIVAPVEGVGVGLCPNATLLLRGIGGE